MQQQQQQQQQQQNCVSPSFQDALSSHPVRIDGDAQSVAKLKDDSSDSNCSIGSIGSIGSIDNGDGDSDSDGNNTDNPAVKERQPQFKKILMFEQTSGAGDSRQSKNSSRSGSSSSSSSTTTTKRLVDAAVVASAPTKKHTLNKRSESSDTSRTVPLSPCCEEREHGIVTLPFGNEDKDSSSDSDDNDDGGATASTTANGDPHTTSRPSPTPKLHPLSSGSDNSHPCVVEDVNGDIEGDGDLLSKKDGGKCGDGDGGNASSGLDGGQRHSTLILIVIITILGCATCAAFLAIGLTGVFSEYHTDFVRDAQSTVVKIQTKFEDYVDAASLIHARCRHYEPGGRTEKRWDRRDFRELYEYIIESGLQFKAMQFDPNITHDDRPVVEEEARLFYAEHYPDIDYQGFVGFNELNSTSLEPRTEQPWYFPIQYMEPIYGNEVAIGLDYYSSESRIRAVDALFETKKPSMTDRLSLVKENDQVSRCGDHGQSPSYGIVLLHPGVELSDTISDGVGSHNHNETGSGGHDKQWPRDMASIVLCVPDLLQRSTESQSDRRFRVYIHDRSHPNDDDVFMGAAQKYGARDDSLANGVAFLPEVSLGDLVDETCEGRKESCLCQDIVVANRVWTVTVVNDESPNTSTIVVVIVGGVIILVAAICLALWAWTSQRRQNRFNHIRAQDEAEKASLILKNARQAAKTERELNDFIAHEVRNPVAAAMVATNFVKNEMAGLQPLSTVESIVQSREDINIIDNALHFINDLLRNMLDMHRANSKQLQIKKIPTDILHDVLEPVAAMLYRGRNNNIKMIVECDPKALYVMTDPLRLKQVILNLGRNSIKFIDQGFIRLRAEEINGNVKILVDDSGSGIPVEKRERLFAKFQESLDALSQGTGIGLHLCQNLVELMGGNISLDECYDSGIAGMPGTRFVVDLQTCSIDTSQMETLTSSTEGGMVLNESFSGESDASDSASFPSELPEELSVLFIDDDFVLRKLFARAIRAVAPGWTIREAANGEAGIDHVRANDFDLIFCDMYMASVEKQLLGTETIAELRNMGCTSRCVGLSANDKEDEFLEAGADAFLFKPIPCEAEALKEILKRALYNKSRRRFTRADQNQTISNGMYSDV